MHIAITGASGNAGTALLRKLQAKLSEKPGSFKLTGISRRRPDTGREPYSGVEWHTLDVGLESDRPLLDAALEGVDSVVHLAWQIQPNRDLEQLYRTNVAGTRNVLAAAARAGVKQVVCASSVGAYSKAPKDQRRDESWPVRGMAGLTLQPAQGGAGRSPGCVHGSGTGHLGGTAPARPDFPVRRR